MKRQIKLTESQLRDVVEEATRRVIQEAGSILKLANYFKQNPAQMKQNMQNANGATNQNGGGNLLWGNIAKALQQMQNQGNQGGTNQNGGGFGSLIKKGLNVGQNMMNNVANAATNTATKLFQNPITASATAANRGRMAANQNKATAAKRAAGRAAWGPLSSLGAATNAAMDASQAARAGLLNRK